MTTTEDQLDRLVDATDIIDEIANGPYGTVLTEQGAVITVTKAITDMTAYTARGAWVTSTAYAFYDLVTEANVVYAVVEDHTSGVFATDLSNGLLAVYQNIGNEYGSISEMKAGSGGILDGVVSRVLGYSSRSENQNWNFQWYSTDLSTEVTADPLSGIYVPINADPTGTTGAWVRLLTDDYVRPEYFGGIPGSGNDSTAAIAAAIASGYPVWRTYGVYTMSDTAGVTLSTSLTLHGPGVFVRDDPAGTGNTSTDGAIFYIPAATSIGKLDVDDGGFVHSSDVGAFYQPNGATGIISEINIQNTEFDEFDDTAPESSRWIRRGDILLFGQVENYPDIVIKNNKFTKGGRTSSNIYIKSGGAEIGGKADISKNTFIKPRYGGAILGVSDTSYIYNAQVKDNWIIGCNLENDPDSVPLPTGYALLAYGKNIKMDDNFVIGFNRFTDNDPISGSYIVGTAASSDEQYACYIKGGKNSISGNHIYDSAYNAAIQFKGDLTATANASNEPKYNRCQNNTIFTRSMLEGAHGTLQFPALIAFRGLNGIISGNDITGGDATKNTHIGIQISDSITTSQTVKVENNLIDYIDHAYATGASATSGDHDNDKVFIRNDYVTNLQTNDLYYFQSFDKFDTILANEVPKFSSNVSGVTNSAEIIVAGTGTGHDYASGQVGFPIATFAEALKRIPIFSRTTFTIKIAATYADLEDITLTGPIAFGGRLNIESDVASSERDVGYLSAGSGTLVYLTCTDLSFKNNISGRCVWTRGHNQTVVLVDCDIDDATADTGVRSSSLINIADLSITALASAGTAIYGETNSQFFVNNLTGTIAGASYGYYAVNNALMSYAGTTPTVGTLTFTSGGAQINT